jgi:aryl-alcohol dehydrogenase-like predicted oxidoreductase
MPPVWDFRQSLRLRTHESNRAPTGVYSSGKSDLFVGQLLKGRRDAIVLATKFFNPMGNDPNSQGGSRRWIVRACEDSLRRSDTDYIDLCQMHRSDPNTDIEETLGALDDLVRAGKVRAVGSSSYPAELIVEAQWAAERRNTVRFRCEQPQYSIFNGAIEGFVLPTCQKFGIGVIPWSPLNSGWLTAKYRKGEVPAGSRRDRMASRPSFNISSPTNQRKFALVEELELIATAAGLRLIDMALAFVMQHPAVTSTIIGADARPTRGSAASSRRHTQRRRAGSHRRRRCARHGHRPRVHGLRASGDLPRSRPSELTDRCLPAGGLTSFTRGTGARHQRHEC